MVETLKFTTPVRQRDKQTVAVTFCGEPLQVDRPKDAVLYFAQQLIGDTVSDADRAMSILQFVNSTLSPVDRKRFFDRVIDRNDPVDQRATLDLIAGLLDRWNNQARGKPKPLVIESDRELVPGEPTIVEHEGLDLRFTAHPPKDIVLLFATASMATGANLGQQAWAISLWLDAALDPPEALMVSYRMQDQNDELDLEHIADIAKELISTWVPAAGNRKARRDAARKKTTTSRRTTTAAKKPAPRRRSTGRAGA